MMLTILRYHRPNYRAPNLDEHRQTFSDHKRQVWHVLYRDKVVPQTPFSNTLGIDGPIYPLAKFRMPKGNKDEQWLEKRDKAYQALRTLWKAARNGYQAMLSPRGVSQRFVDPQLEQMKQGESGDHLAQLDVEKEQILERLRTPNVRARPVLKPDIVPQFDTSSGIFPERYSQQPSKEKLKTRPHDVASTSSLPSVSVELVEKQTPALYQIRPGSTAYRAATALFPDPNDNPAKKCLDWLDFVTAMTEFGFRVEHRGGSAFTFKGNIKLAATPSDTCFRSINFHRPHPSTEMSPILLQGMGRRLNRRYGWQRENFQTSDSA